MNPLPPSPPALPPGSPADDARMRAWLTLRNELAEMHARLEYLRLMLRLRRRAL